MSLVVGVDIATACVRALAVDAAGTVHARAEQSLPPPFSPRPGWVEQDPLSWWPAVERTLSCIAAALGARAASIVAISVCATSGTVVALDAAMRPVGSALTYADQRAVHQAEIARAADPQRWTSLGLTISASFGLPKWGWIAQQPEFSSVRHLCHVSDVVVAHLTGGMPPTDWSHALKSGYDPQKNEWSTAALDALGIDQALLPEVRRPTEQAGTVCGMAAASTGMPAGCAVKLGMTDSCASQIAAGAGLPGSCVSVLGSTLVTRGVSETLPVDPTGAVYSHRHPDGRWLPGGASSVGGRAVAAGWPGADLPSLDAAAAAFGPAGCVIYPLMGRGERFPFVNPSAEGFTVGRPDSMEERYRATLEGVAFTERLGYEHLRSLGVSIKAPISFTGRGSSSPVWNTIRASVLGMPATRKSAAGTALGACILAAAGTLHPHLRSATDAMSVRGTPVEPNRSEQPALEDNYFRFIEALQERRWLEVSGPGKP